MALGTKKKKVIKVVLIVVAIFILINIAGTQIWYLNYKGYFPGSKGNGKEYALKNVETIENSPLKGMTIGQLGSSVTYGARSKKVSFSDYIATRNDCTCIKEAVSGTTLVTSKKDSYVDRLVENFDKYQNIDLMMVQLSTNDAGKNPSPLGEISESKNLKDFDTDTVIGAIEYIVAYSQETWNCPVVFYTCPKNSKGGYDEMVDALYQIQDKWGIGIIDLYNELDINDPNYDLYMADEIHPSQAGYLEWWTPVMEEYLYENYGK